MLNLAKTIQKNREIMASRQSGRILTGTLSAVDTYQTNDNEKVDCGVVFYGDYRILISLKSLNIKHNENETDQEQILLNLKKAARGMIGSEIDFIVTKIDKENKIAIGSRKLAMERRKNIELNRHKVGDKVKVRVISVGTDSCKVECCGIETKVPIKEIAWGYVNEISTYVQVGIKLDAIIKEIDAENNNIRVSIKDATKDHYEDYVKTINKGSIYAATVTGIAEYGIFLSIKERECLSVLCPLPKWSNFNPIEGQIYSIKIKAIDCEKKKISGNLMRLISNGKSN